MINLKTADRWLKKNWGKVAIFATLTIAILAFAFWQVQFANKAIKNEELIQKNQQFLDAIKLFENEELSTKKGALLHLENLALASPAHRQQVLNFLNSQNLWILENGDELKNVNSNKWEKWKNGGGLILSEESVPKKTQLLSAEISKIYERILRKHGEQFPKFSKKEKGEFMLDFSNFTFSQVDFGKINFPQAKFQNAKFFGDAGFGWAKFSSDARFNYVEFYGNANFWSTEFFNYAGFGSVRFYGDTSFKGADFFSNTDFLGTEFSNSANFWLADFSGYAWFAYAKFYGDTSFEHADFSCSTDFQDVNFFSDTNFQNTKFPSDTDLRDIKFPKKLFAENCDLRKCSTNFLLMSDFVSKENAKKFYDAGALFSDEQKKHFELVEKVKSKNNEAN